MTMFKTGLAVKVPCFIVRNVTEPSSLDLKNMCGQCALPAAREGSTVSTASTLIYSDQYSADKMLQLYLQLLNKLLNITSSF